MASLLDPTMTNPRIASFLYVINAINQFLDSRLSYKSVGTQIVTTEAYALVEKLVVAL